VHFHVCAVDWVVDYHWTSRYLPVVNGSNRCTAEVLGTAMQLASLNDIDRRMLKEFFRVEPAMQHRLQLDYMR
jgi:hypothetical protein